MGAHRKNPPTGAAQSITEMAEEGHAKIAIADRMGVTLETFTRWLEEDERLQAAFDLGLAKEEQLMLSLVIEAALKNGDRNANACFILASRHGYRDRDSKIANFNVDVSVGPSVMIVRDHGDDTEFFARAAAQQAELVANASSPSPVAKPLQLEATVTPIQVVPAPPPPPYAPVAPSWPMNPIEWKKNA